MKKKNKRNLSGEIIGESLSTNAQNASKASFDGMSLFRDKVYGKMIQNGQFEQGKGSLFEYIEAAKFNKDAALKGSSLNAEVTDVYDSGAAADILIKDNGKTVREVQAKFVKSTKDGRDNSAASSIFDQAGGQKGHWGKYKGMERLIRKDDNYNKDGSMLKEAQKLAKTKGDSPTIHADDYKDVAENLTDELSHDNISSGGTTYEEVKTAYDNPEKYMKDFKKAAYKEETRVTAENMAKASFVTAGIFSGIVNLVKVYKEEESLSDAAKNVAKDSIKSGIRGYATGVIGSSIRHSAMEKGNVFLSAADASTIFAGGMIDGGVSLLSFVKGDINEKELATELVSTICTSTVTLYFSRGLTAALGTALNPVLSIAIYTAAGVVKSCIGEIIRKGNLEIEELNRATALLQESTKQEREFIEKFKQYVSKVETETQKQFDNFIHVFEYNMSTDDNYDLAIDTIVRFADYMGIELPYLKFDEFDNAMKNKVVFKL